MRRLFATLIVIALLVVGFGFYRGWFTLSSSSPAADTDKTNVNVTVDRGKMNEDAAAVKTKTAELADNVNETASDLGEPAQDKDKAEPTEPK